MDMRREMALVAFLALLTRLPFVATNEGLLYDEALYLSIGRNLSHNLLDYTMNFNYMTYRPPLLPYVLSILFSLDRSDFSARMLSILFSCVTTGLTYYFSRRHFSRRVALLASFFLLSSPLFFKYSLRILAHMPYALFSTCAVFFFVEGLTQDRKLYLAGACAGLAFLSRYVGVMFFLFVFLFLLLENRTSLRVFLRLPLRKKHLWGCLLSFLCVLFPWLVYNYRIFGNPLKFVTVASDVIRMDMTTTDLAFVISSVVEVTPWMLLLSGAGLVLLLRERHNLMLAWTAASVAVLLGVNHKESRYLTDFMPLIAIAAAVGYDGIARRLSRKWFWSAAGFLCVLSFIVGVVDVYERRNIGEELVEVGRFISQDTSGGGLIMAQEEAQMYYYTGRKVFPFPRSAQEFAKIIGERDISYLVVNAYRKPSYLEEYLGEWRMVFSRGSYSVYRRNTYGSTVRIL